MLLPLNTLEGSAGKQHFKDWWTPSYSKSTVMFFLQQKQEKKFKKNPSHKPSSPAQKSSKSF